MTKEQIEKRCKEKEQELLLKYFGGLVQEAAIERPETIGEYEKELPLKIEAEYREFLRGLWADVAPNITRPVEKVLDEQRLRELMTEDDREGIDHAYREAKKRTLWERLTKTNHKDVTFYKGLLEEYTRELLLCMRCDFLEESTGQLIRNKTFESAW